MLSLTCGSGSGCFHKLALLELLNDVAIPDQGAAYTVFHAEPRHGQIALYCL